jgi:hypothetical protein
MDLFPPREKHVALLRDHVQRPAYVASLHSVDPYQFRRAISAKKIDFRLPVAKHVNMGWLMVIKKNDEAKPARSMNSDHQNNLT